MANAERKAKSGNDWTCGDLSSYNIDVIPKTGRDFFRVPFEDLVPSMDSALTQFDYSTGDELANPKPMRKFLQFLDLATRPLSNQGSVVDDFARELLSAMDYDTGDRVVRTRNEIRFTVCGSHRVAQTGVCVVKQKKTYILLLIQEDKRLQNQDDPEPQIIAEAIAAFQENNRIRIESGHSTLDTMVFPCITMIGTFPRFYLVPVTSELSGCVMKGQFPASKTLVTKYIPGIPGRVNEGMKPVHSRRVILQCYEGFKRYADELEKLLEAENEN